MSRGKLGFAAAVSAYGDSWRIGLEVDYWDAGMDREGDAVLMSSGRSRDDVRESVVMQECVRAAGVLQ